MARGPHVRAIPAALDRPRQGQRRPASSAPGRRRHEVSELRPEHRFHSRLRRGRKRNRRLACKCSVTDRKSTRLNSSHSQISYAVFCLKKKKKKKTNSDT